MGYKKSPRVTRTLLSILADLNNAVVKIVFIRSSISKFSRLLTKPLGTVPSMLIRINITVTFMFYSFFSSPARSNYLSLFLFSFVSTLLSPEMAKSALRQVSFSFYFFFFDNH